VVSDRLQVKQSSGNLVTNAIKYTKAGSVTLSMRAAGPAWQIIVEDTGVGIRAEDLKRVFTEFERVGFTAEIRGTGLGLAITQSLVELLHGRIEVESEVGKGSRFQVTLPLSAQC